MSDQLSSDLASLRIPRDAPRRSPQGSDDGSPRGSPHGAPKAGGRFLAYVLASVIAACVIGGAFVAAPFVESKIFRPEVDVTEIALVSPQQGSVELTSTGYVIAESTSKVSAKIEGRIARIHVKEGDTVKLGDVLAELDDVDQRSAIAASKSRALALRAREQAARASLAEAKLQFERQRGLAERGAAPKATAEDLQARVSSLEEGVKASAAEATAAEAEVKSLAVALNHATITAPIAGRVIDKAAEVGEMVGPTRSTIVELADFSTLIVETDVPESRLHRVKVGGPCEIVLDAYPGKRYRGSTFDIVPKVNRAKATVAVKVTFVDPPEGVLPDMAARVSFLDRPIDDEAIKAPTRLIVPAAAVGERGGAKIVFVLDGDQLRIVPVRLGAAFGNGFELAEGPPAGTRVVKNPAEVLENGTRVIERSR